MKDKTYKNILWWGMAALLIFTPLARGAVRVWSITPVLIIAYTLIFMWLWRENNSKSGKVFFTKRDSFLCHTSLRISGGKCPVTVLGIVPLLFTVLALISFIFSIYKHDSFYALLKLFAYLGIYYFLVNNFDNKMFQKLFNLAILIATGLSIYGILQYFGLLSHSWWVPKEFLAATYVNHNHFAGYLELVIPMGIVVLLNSGIVDSGTVPLGRRGLALAGTVPVMLVAFILAQSRGAWVCLAISLFVMILILVKRRIIKPRSLLIFVILVVLIFSASFFLEAKVSKRMKTMSDAVLNIDNSREATLESRIKIWQGALGMIRERPLIGVGIGDFDHGFYPYRPKGLNMRAVFAHNEYLHMAAEMGILSPLLMLLFFIAAIRAGLRNNRNFLVLGCTIGVLALLLHAIVDFNFHIPANMLLFTVYLAFIAKESSD